MGVGGDSEQVLSGSFFLGSPKLVTILALRALPTVFAFALWLVVCITPAGAQSIGATSPQSASRTSAQSAADSGADVRAIFAAKCLECHNPDSDSSKARRDFDGAWDMALIIEAWSDPIAFDLAPLWEVAEERSMPPEDSDVQALTTSEAQQLLQWLEIGSPLPADGNRFVDLQMAARFLADDLAPTTSRREGKRSLMERLLIWFGRNHAATTHFPVALLLLAALMRLCQRGAWRQQAWRAESFCLTFGAPLAAITAGLGWLNAANSGAAGDLLWRHRWVGIGVAVTAMLLLLLRRKFGKRKVYSVLLVLLALTVAIVGHQGGEMVFGESYLDF